jgi:excisionase family DNA binding protein
VAQQLPPSSNGDEDPWLTRTEAAEYVKVSTATLRRGYQSGDLQSARLPNGRSLRFRRSWLDTWIMNGHGVYAAATILALLFAGWLVACVCGSDQLCDLHQLLEHVERRV